MNSRRRASLYSGDTPAITPQPIVSGLLSRVEMVSLIADLRKQLFVERRTNQRAQRALTEHLDELQKALDGIRVAYVTEKALRPIIGRQQ